ncbi:gamma-butyrobetaine hydroxylase-like domain-containing protein [Planctomycetota bacterium]
MIRPTGMKLLRDVVLEITWSDNIQHQIPLEALRKSCPCATCREKRTTDQAPSKPDPSVGLQVLSLAETQPLRIESMQPIGNYAYGIRFSDGHDTGIFTIEFLRRLGEVVAGEKTA